MYNANRGVEQTRFPLSNGDGTIHQEKFNNMPPCVFSIKVGTNSRENKLSCKKKYSINNHLQTFGSFFQICFTLGVSSLDFGIVAYATNSDEPAHIHSHSDSQHVAIDKVQTMN